MTVAWKSNVFDEGRHNVAAAYMSGYNRKRADIY